MDCTLFRCPLPVGQGHVVPGLNGPELILVPLIDNVDKCNDENQMGADEGSIRGIEFVRDKLSSGSTLPLVTCSIGYLMRISLLVMDVQ